MSTEKPKSGLPHSPYARWWVVLLMGLLLCSGRGIAWAQVAVTVPTLPPGKRIIVQFDATINTPFPLGVPSVSTQGSITATVSGNPVGPFLTDDNPGTATPNEPTVTAVTVLQADITLAKQVDILTPNSGDVVTFTVTATNGGPEVATGLQITDVLPAGLTLLQATPAQGTYDTATGVWDIGSLAVGASTSLAIQTSVQPGTGEATLTNTAQVSALGQVDPVSSDNTASASITPQEADLVITKTGPGSITRGATLTYTIAVTNNGPSVATGVSVTDPTPAGLTFLSADAPCAAGFPCTLGTLTVGQTVSMVVHYAVPTTYAGADPLVNVASVASAVTDPLPGNNNSQSSTAVDRLAVADLSVTMQGPTSATTGATVTYTITTSNAGTDDATSGVTLDTPTPTGLTFVSATEPCTGGFPCSLGALNAGASSAVQVTFTIPTAYAGANPIVTTASVNSSASDPNTANNTASASTQVFPPGSDADLVVTHTGPIQADPRTNPNVTYNITVTNQGPNTATGVTLNNPTPSGLTLLSITAPCAAGFPCALGSLAASANVAVTVTFEVPDPYTGPNPITTTATAAANEPDNTLANNSATVTTGITGVDVLADLGLTANGPATVVVGNTVTYTVVLSNAGPSTANTVVLSHTLPTGVTLSNISAPCSSGLPCNLGNLSAGSATAVNVTFQVPANFVTTNVLVYTASVSSATNDTNAANNTATVQTTVTTGNTSPVAADDSATTIAGTPVTIAVLSNDSDPDGDPLTVTISTLPTHGKAEPNTNNTVTYIPDPQFLGTDTFTYSISDGHTSASATITVMVVAAEVDISTPDASGEVIAGSAVAIAAFNLPSAGTTGSNSAVTTAAIPVDTVAVNFQFQDTGSTLWTDIAEATNGPFFFVPWDTTQVPDSTYFLRAVARRSNGSLEPSSPLPVQVDNIAPVGPLDILETPEFRTQHLRPSTLNIVVTSQGVVMTVPDGAINADLDLTVDQPTQNLSGFPGTLITEPTRILLHSNTQTLQNPARLFLPYLDSDQNGRTDGADIDETTLSLWFSEDGSGAWTPVSGAVVQRDINMLEAMVTRLGVFGIFATTSPGFTVSAGEQTPATDVTIKVSDHPESVTVLQGRLDIGAEEVNLLEVTVVLSPALDSLPFLDRIQVQILHDANGNGQRDANETVLATTAIDGTSMTLPLTTPLTLAPMTTTYFLVTLGTGNTGTGTRTGWLLLVPVAFGLILGPWRRHAPRWLWLGMLLVMCSMVSVSCDHDGHDAEEEITLTVPAHGVRAEGVRSGPLSGPTSPLVSPNIVIVP